MGRAFEVRKAAMMKTGLQKSKLYSRYGKEIYMAAKTGGPDPDSNLTLKRVIEKAKKEQIPSDVIKRNIEKAKGGVGEDYASARYEAFGPAGTTLIIEALTDNVNRTVSELKTAFNRTGAKLGASGSVMHQYNHQGVISFTGLTEDEVLEALLENDAEIIDVEVDEDMITITTEPGDFNKAKDAIKAVYPDLEFIDDEVTYLPNEYIDVDDETKGKFERLLALLDELDDVQDVYHNVNL